MKIFGLALALLLGPGSLAQQLPIEGTWRIKPDTNVTAGKPLTVRLADGLYDCESCTPPIHGFVADGKDHPVQQSDFDTLNVAVADQNTVKEIQKKDGKMLGEVILTVAPDGNSLSFQGTFKTADGREATNSGKFVRTGPVPDKGHRLSGSWQQTSMNMDAALLYATYKMDPDGTLNYDDKVGSRYAAKLDGKDYPMSGDDVIKFVSVRKIDNNTFEESYKDAAGKIRLVSTTKVAADGRHASMTNENKETGNVYHFEAEKE